MGNTQGYKDFADLSNRIHSKACHTLLQHIKEHRDAMIEQLQLSPNLVLFYGELNEEAFSVKLTSLAF